MNENKQNTTLLTVIAVATLLVAVVGSTFAYFTANTPNQSTSTITATSGKMIIAYADNSAALDLSETEVRPGSNTIIHKKFTLTGTNSANGGVTDGSTGLGMPYTVGLVYTNEFTAEGTGATPTGKGGLVYNLTATPGDGATAILENGGNAIIPTAATESYLKLASGVFNPTGAEITVSFDLQVTFPETNENQDENKSKSFSGYISVNNKQYESSSAAYTTQGA